MTAPSISYIESDFTSADESLREYRSRTTEPSLSAIRRAYRRLARRA